MKTCPYCAELVQPAAILCKHCRSDLGGRSAGRLGALLLAAALGAGVMLLVPVLGSASAWATARPARQVPVTAGGCPYRGPAGVHPARPPMAGMPGHLPAWHPPIGDREDEGDGVDGWAVPPFAPEGARTL